jgi:hypothetical protein
MIGSVLAGARCAEIGFVVLNRIDVFAIDDLLDLDPVVFSGLISSSSSRLKRQVVPSTEVECLHRIAPFDLILAAVAVSLISYGRHARFAKQLEADTLRLNAAYSLTGMFTSPKAMEPFQMDRMGRRALKGLSGIACA